MAFTITSMRRSPDIGFQSVSRHTAEGAAELAATLKAEGALEVEIRDDRGRLVTKNDLARIREVSHMREYEVLRRLSPAV